MLRIAVKGDGLALKYIHDEAVRRCCVDYSSDVLSVWTSGTYIDMERVLQNALYTTVFEKDGKAQGYGFLRHSGAIWHLYVAPQAQGLGIGRLLLQDMERALKEKGFNKAVLEANTNAVTFYKQNGYHILEETFITMLNQKVRIFRMEKLL